MSGAPSERCLFAQQAYDVKIYFRAIRLGIFDISGDDVLVVSNIFGRLSRDSTISYRFIQRSILTDCRKSLADHFYFKKRLVNTVVN